jgi:hypothetical protein
VFGRQTTNREEKGKVGYEGMTHYRQIIINLAVEDNTPPEEVSKLKEKIDIFVNEVKNPKVIKEVSVRVN